MYGQQQAQQQVQPNQQTIMNQMGQARLIMPGTRMPVPQGGMINAGMQQQQQPQQQQVSDGTIF